MALTINRDPEHFSYSIYGSDNVELLESIRVYDNNEEFVGFITAISPDPNGGEIEYHAIIMTPHDRRTECFVDESSAYEWICAETVDIDEEE